MEAVYRILIRVFYPAHFRRTYERQVLAAAREEAGRPENQSALGRILLAHEVIGDLFLSGLRLRVAQVVGRLRVAGREMQLAAAGGPAGVGQNQMEEVLMQSANDRLKERASGHLWLALILSTGLHAAAFWAFPDLTAAVETNDPATTVIVSVPDLPLPPPPEALPAPAHPVPAATAPVDVVPPTFQQLWDEAADPPPPPPVATERRIPPAGLDRTPSDQAQYHQPVRGRSGPGGPVPTPSSRCGDRGPGPCEVLPPGRRHGARTGRRRVVGPYCTGSGRLGRGGRHAVLAGVQPGVTRAGVGEPSHRVHRSEPVGDLLASLAALASVPRPRELRRPLQVRPLSSTGDNHGGEPFQVAPH